MEEKIINIIKNNPGITYKQIIEELENEDKQVIFDTLWSLRDNVIEYDEDDNEIEHYYIISSNGNEGVNDTKTEFVGINVGINVGIKWNMSIIQTILAEIKRNPYSTAISISKVIGVSDRTIERHIKQLKKYGLISRVGSKKNGYYIIIKPLTTDTCNSGGI